MKPMKKTNLLLLTAFFLASFANILLSKAQPVETFDFKITTWNVEWLSCQAFGPNDRELQINNIVSVIKAMRSDLVALQEVGTSTIYTTIDTLVRRLGSEWAGYIVPNSYDNCGQNQGIVYKKSKMEIVSYSLIINGGSSYYWSNGRFPALYNVNLLTNDVQIPVSFVNIHAKAMSDRTSYDRRKGASAGLKNLLDGSTYNAKKIVIIGDFNDFLEGTQCGDCGGISGDSPYKNFMDDTANYKGLTMDLIDPYYDSPVIDNVIISNELFDNYVSNSVEREVSATLIIENYRNTTSNHTPVSVTFRFEDLETRVTEIPVTSFLVYPNPTTNMIHIQTGNETKPEVKLYAIDGRILQHIYSTEINISNYPAGIYFVQVEGRMMKVVKE
jgi:exonuclease III